MILLQGERVGCEQCIRGHRAADCKHLDKYLISIKGRGRPAIRDESIRLRITPKAIVIKTSYEPIESKNGRGKAGTTKLCFHLHPDTKYEYYKVKLGKGFKILGPANDFKYQRTFKITSNGTVPTERIPDDFPDDYSDDTFASRRELNSLIQRIDNDALYRTPSPMTPLSTPILEATNGERKSSTTSMSSTSSGTASSDSTTDFYNNGLLHHLENSTMNAPNFHWNSESQSPMITQVVPTQMNNSNYQTFHCKREDNLISNINADPTAQDFMMGSNLSEFFYTSLDITERYPDFLEEQ